MGIEVEDYINVSEKLKALGGKPSLAFALLPKNLDTAITRSELRQFSETDTVRTLFRNGGFHYDEIFEDGEQPAYIQNHSYEWFGPTLFVSASLLSQDPTCITVALGLITNYLTEAFRGGGSGGKNHLEIVCEFADGSTKKVSYTGDSEGIARLPEILKNIKHG